MGLIGLSRGRVSSSFLLGWVFIGKYVSLGDAQGRRVPVHVRGVLEQHLIIITCELWRLADVGLVETRRLRVQRHHCVQYYIIIMRSLPKDSA